MACVDLKWATHKDRSRQTNTGSTNTNRISRTDILDVNLQPSHCKHGPQSREPEVRTTLSSAAADTSCPERENSKHVNAIWDIVIIKWSVAADTSCPERENSKHMNVIGDIVTTNTEPEVRIIKWSVAADASWHRAKTKLNEIWTSDEAKKACHALWAWHSPPPQTVDLFSFLLF